MKNTNFKIIGVAAGLLLAWFAFPEKSFALTHIADCQDLQDVNLDLDEDYVLDGDIDCDGFDFTALGTYTGVFDGAGYAINNLVLNESGVNTQGLFTVLDGADVKNLSITGASVLTNYEGGILAARAADSFVYNVHVTGQIGSTAAVSTTGGLIGRIERSNVYYSYAEVNVTGIGILGGLVGEAQDGSLITRSAAGGSVSGVDNLGGLVGDLSDSQINNSYAFASVTGVWGQVGGAIGRTEGESIIDKIYAIGAVSSLDDSFIGGLVGAASAETESSASYWNMQTTGQADSAAGNGRTTAEMKTPTTFSGWNTTHTWNLTQGNYPTFLAYPADAPVLTEVEQLPGAVVTPNSLVYRFSANKFGLFTMENCGAGSQVLDIDAGTVVLSGLEVGKTYECDFSMQDLDGVSSNDLTVGPTTTRRRVSGSYSPNRSHQSVQPQPVVDGQPAVPDAAEPTLPPLVLTRNLFYGVQGADVKWLQQFFNAHGFKLADTGPGSPGNETEFFGPLTRDAAMRYQQAKGITPVAGYVGPITRGFINSQP